MSIVRELSEEDLDDFVTIVANAYPAFSIYSKNDKQKFKQILVKIQNEDATTHLYGLYRRGKLLGGMRLHDFAMNLLGVRTLLGGVGLLAVDLLHKREKVCKELITYFLNYYKKKGACMVSLYPFRPDFYKKMGFGFGTKMNQYRITPAQLPKGESREHIQFIGESDRKALLDCYNRFAEKTHGMIEKTKFELVRFLDNPENRIVGYKERNRILGYVVFVFKERGEENSLISDVEIKELIYETREALLELLTFLHTQKDQIRHIIINTQEEYFHHILRDPRNDSGHVIPHLYHESNVSGVGIMYRAIDTERVFRVLKTHNFGSQDCRLRLSIWDSFFPENEGKYIVHFERGIPHTDRREYEVEISLDVSDFSSLVMGVITFSQLYRCGLAEISNTEYLKTVTRIFRTEEKPLCTTRF